MSDPIYFIDRGSGERQEEQVYYEAVLRFLYTTKPGWTCAKLIAHLPFISKTTGWLERLPLSRRKIIPFIQKYGLNPDEFVVSPENFSSFDDFFTRKLKPETRPLTSGPIIPADGRYLVYPDLNETSGFVVKGKTFSLEKLLGDDETLYSRYKHGSMVLARLCPTDYHRFHFPCSGTPYKPHLINGPLYSVNPLALKKYLSILVENKRVLTEIDTDTHGKLLYIEIGATSVGSIHQTFTPEKPVQKGDEKGFFSFGGSSLILLFEPGAITFAPDLLANSSQFLETRCLFGQSLTTLLK
ncbi:MAG: Phosphatidylserine decarboxylase proenzyme [Chlamydiae bacterium]|nr:Phosphatidylserine decarboxylase proenzyme [Chlamydiota bacterium]